MKILVVDDETMIRRALVRAMESKGVPCDEAVNGSEALRLLEKNSYQCILLDMIMPEKNGFEVLKEYKGDSSIIIMTAFSGEESLMDHPLIKEDQRIRKVFQKPFDNVFQMADQVLSLIQESPGDR